MTHPIIRSEIFIETAFERRFQAMLRSAWHKRSWHVIVADPGAGKTMGIRDLIRTAGSPAILAVTAPKNNEEEMALGNHLFSALGLPIRGRWSDRKPNTSETVGTVGEQVQTVKTPKCTFSGVVSIELQRFLDSGVTLVECPDCARMRTLSPSKGVLRFPSHDKRKTNAPVTSQRWAMCETIWEVIGGESK
jgi:hypothetical protein